MNIFSKGEAADLLAQTSIRHVLSSARDIVSSTTTSFTYAGEPGESRAG